MRPKLKVISNECEHKFQKKVNKFLKKNEHISSIKYMSVDGEFAAMIHYYSSHDMMVEDYKRLKALHKRTGKKFKVTNDTN